MKSAVRTVVCALCVLFAWTCCLAAQVPDKPRAVTDGSIPDDQSLLKPVINEGGRDSNLTDR